MFKKHDYREMLAGLSDTMLAAMEAQAIKDQSEASKKLYAVHNEMKRRKKGLKWQP